MKTQMFDIHVTEYIAPHDRVPSYRARCGAHATSYGSITDAVAHITDTLVSQIIDEDEPQPPLREMTIRIHYTSEITPLSEDGRRELAERVGDIGLSEAIHEERESGY